MSDETNGDPELSAWRAEWQTLGAGEEYAAKLVARASRDGRRLWRAALGEVLGVVFSTTLCLILAVRSHGAIEVVALTGLVLVFNGAWLTYFFTLREGTFRASGEGTEAYVALTRRRLATDRQWIRYGRRWTVVLCALLLPWSVRFAFVHRALYRADPWRAAVGFGGVAVILGGLALWLRYKARKAEEQEALFEREIARADLA